MIKTIIMCGGRGSRLKPLTDRVPKPLVPLNGKPLLQHVVKLYLRKGFKKFVLCVGYRADMVRDFFVQSDFVGQFDFSDAGETASILQRLYQARTLIGDRAFVAYGDTLIDVDLEDMLTHHQKYKASITITTANVRSPFGLISTDANGWATSFEEKPLQTYYVGHMLIERHILDTIRPDLLAMPDGAGLVRLFGELITQRQLQTYHYTGPQITFNTHQELDQAERDFVAFFTHQED